MSGTLGTGGRVYTQTLTLKSAAFQILNNCCSTIGDTSSRFCWLPACPSTSQLWLESILAQLHPCFGGEARELPCQAKQGLPMALVEFEILQWYRSQLGPNHFDTTILIFLQSYSLLMPPKTSQAYTFTRGLLLALIWQTFNLKELAWKSKYSVRKTDIYLAPWLSVNISLGIWLAGIRCIECFGSLGQAHKKSTVAGDQSVRKIGLFQCWDLCPWGFTTLLSLCICPNIILNSYWDTGMEPWELWSLTSIFILFWASGLNFPKGRRLFWKKYGSLCLYIETTRGIWRM